MPGIMGIISEKKKLENINILDTFHKEPSVSYLIDSARFSKAYFCRLSVNKFQNDKIFKRIGKNLISTEGIILNSKYLLHQYKTKNLSELILKLYRLHDLKLFEKLRGNFSGFIYYNNKLIVFTDHYASKSIYYFFNEESKVMIFSSELKVVVKIMKELGYSPHLDIQGAYCLLTLGFMLGDLTLVEGVKKLPPGNILIYKDGQINLEEYYRISCEPNIEEDEEEIIKELDKRFREAVKLEYEKDLEYGYSHIATLSAGLDSRTNVAYAKKIGVNNLTCFTFSESGYLDENIAKKICSDNHFEFIFYALDNGDYLIKNIDDIISSNDGLVLYSGSAHLYNCLRKISLHHFGLIHTGLIGDVALGAYLQNKKHNINNNKMLNKISCSTKLINILEKIVNNNQFEYENDELFAFYVRSVNGLFNGFRMIEQFTEFCSPTLYVDFFDYAIKINPKLRYKEVIYLKWINKSIPKFTRYIWEKHGLPPKWPILLLETYTKARALKRNITMKYNPRYSMIPFEYWWRNNNDLKNKINKIFDNNINFIQNENLKENCNSLFVKGTLKEKTQIITLLKAVKMLNIS